MKTNEHNSNFDIGDLVAVSHLSAELIAFLWNNLIQNSSSAEVGEPYEPALTCNQKRFIIK